MSKLEFHIVEIPEGESHRDIVLEKEDIDLTPYSFKCGKIEIDFYRALHFIQVDFCIKSDIELQCDRSLEYFDYPVEAKYEVVFKVDAEEETEDEKCAIRRFNFSSNTFSIKDEVRDTLLLQIPMQKIHPKFLNDKGKVEEFQTKTFGINDDSDTGPKIDPRWEALKELKN